MKVLSVIKLSACRLRKHIDIIAFIWALLVLLFILFRIGTAEAEVDRSLAVIHHTATAKTTSVECIRRYHVEKKGWDDIGYHFLIDWEGYYMRGRPLTRNGAHALGRNHYVGIALIGHSEFTQDQVDTLMKLLIKLGVKKIERHHEECPGPGIDIEALQKLLTWYNVENKYIILNDKK